MRILSWIPVLLLTSVPISGAELSLLAGYRTGGPSIDLVISECLIEYCTDGIDGRDGAAYGLILDLPVHERLMFEVLIGYQSIEMVEKYVVSPGIPPPAPRRRRFDLTTLHFGLQRRWQRSKASPFAAAGIGVTRLEADRRLFRGGEQIEADRLSASLAGGLQIDLTEWLGLRLEGRGYWTDARSSLREDLLQVELSTGLTFRM